MDKFDITMIAVSEEAERMREKALYFSNQVDRYPGKELFKWACRLIIVELALAYLENPYAISKIKESFEVEEKEKSRQGGRPKQD